MGLEPPKPQTAYSADAYATGCFVCGHGADGEETNRPRQFRAGPNGGGLLVDNQCYDRRMGLVRQGVIQNWWESPEAAAALEKEEAEAAAEKARQEVVIDENIPVGTGPVAVDFRGLTEHEKQLGRQPRWGEKKPESVEVDLLLPSATGPRFAEWEMKGGPDNAWKIRLARAIDGLFIEVQAPAYLDPTTASQIARALMSASLYQL